MIAELIQKVAGLSGGKSSPYYIRPSLASPDIPELDHQGKCKRQMVYWALNFPQDNVSDRMFLVFDDSSWHEELTRNWINKTTWKLRDENFEVNCGFFRKGKIDGILTDLLGQDYLWEHKAINHFSFERYASGKLLPIDYIAQCCIYLVGLQSYLTSCSQVLLLLKNKNTAQYLEFLIEYDPAKDTAKILHRLDSISQEKIDLNIEINQILKRTQEKFEYVEECKTKKILPPRDYSFEDWNCNYCQYQKTCWKDYKEEFESRVENIVLVNNDITEEKLARYLELQAQMQEMEKEQEQIKKEVKAILQEKNAKEATTERYTIKLSLVKSQRVNKDLIPANILPLVMKESLQERLSIREKEV